MLEQLAAIAESPPKDAEGGYWHRPVKPAVFAGGSARRNTALTALNDVPKQAVQKSLFFRKMH